jgi:hypothetical protein
MAAMPVKAAQRVDEVRALDADNIQVPSIAKVGEARALQAGVLAVRLARYWTSDE